MNGAEDVTSSNVRSLGDAGGVVLGVGTHFDVHVAVALVWLGRGLGELVTWGVGNGRLLPLIFAL